MRPLSLAFKLHFPGVYSKRPVGYMLSFLKDKSNVLTLSLKHLNVYLNPDQVKKKKTTAEGGTAKTNIHLTFLMND